MGSLRCSRGSWRPGRGALVLRLVFGLVTLLLLGVLVPGITAPAARAVPVDMGEIVGHVKTLNGDPVIMDVYFYLKTGPTTWDYAGSSMSDNSQGGRYASPWLTPGQYRIYFATSTWYLGEYWNNKSDWDVADSVQAVAGTTTELPDTIVSPAGIITGTVTGPGGAPLDGSSDVRVTAYNPDWSHAQPTEETSVAASSGPYELGGLRTGNYYLEFYDANGVYATEYYHLRISKERADLLGVTAGHTLTNISQALPKAGAIAGTVRSQSGALLGGIYVSVYASDGAGGWDLVGSESTSYYDGSYAVYRLPPGKYKVAFSDGAKVWATQYYNNKPSLDAGDYVTVTSQHTTTINATLVSAPTVTGL